MGSDRVRVWGGDDRPWFPWQIKVLECMADEIALLGGKGSGKSEIMRAWLVSGNPDQSDFDENGAEIPWNRSYMFHPEYRGLILRKNEGDLADFIKRAAVMWEPYGIQYTNGRFEHPCGATIDCGHMRDDTAWMKYIGIEYQRIAIDEAGLIKEYALFDELRSCMRSPYKELRIQVLLASNAGGPGTSWLIERYMKARDENKQIIPHGNIITEDYKHLHTGKPHKRTRIWIFSTAMDNPLYRDGEYIIQLQSMEDPKKRAAYLDGQWDALYGSYFGDLFRPEGPRKSNDEPENANHVIPANSVKLQLWWHRSIGMDWGYAHEAAILWGCQDPSGRVHVYRELAASQASAEKLGYELALMTREELEKSPSHSMVLHLSHDAFKNDGKGDKSIAEIIGLGIGRVLGPSSVHIPDIIAKNLQAAFDREPYNFRTKEEQEQAISAIKKQRRTGITIRIAEKTSVIGWQHCRELLRWETIGEHNAKYDPKLANQLLQQDPQAFDEYCKLFRNVRPESLPRLQIWDNCKRLIEGIPKAQHKDGEEAMAKEHFKGRDSVDAWFYLLLGMRDEAPPEPFEEFRGRSLETLIATQPDITTNDLVRVNMALEAEWKEKIDRKCSPYTPMRGARYSRMFRQGQIKPQRFNGRI